MIVNTCVCSMESLTICALVLVIAMSTGAEYYGGTLIGSFNTSSHGVAGQVYIVDEKRFLIRQFSYDGAATDAFFYIGTSGTPNSQGTKIADENGSNVLGKYTGKDLVLTLPANVNAGDITWLSVWSKDIKANFGHVTFASGLVVPAPVDLHPFSLQSHGVSSGMVTVMDTRKLVIKKLIYDGQCPDAFFWVGTTASPDASGTIVNDENGSKDILKTYDGSKDTTLVLDETMSWRELRWLSVWCRNTTHNFGHVIIPQNLTVPPYLPAGAGSWGVGVLGNYEQLHDHLAVSWEIDGNNVIIELSGALESNGYMAFGVSGSLSRSSMVGGDVAVCYYDDQDGPKAVDYYLQDRAYCSGSNGVCPDIASGQNDNLEVISGSFRQGITTVRYKRPLAVGETQTDRRIPPNHDVYVIWAMGQLNAEMKVTKHSLRTEGNLKIYFGRTNERKCTGVKRRDNGKVVPWEKAYLMGDKNPVITARMGPAGGKKGYSAITGQQSWGIAWYLNGQLIPTLVLKRGQTFTFIIEGGNDANNGAEYHPFYITDDKIGGYVAKTATEKQYVKMYAGVENGQPMSQALGRYCEYKVTSQSSAPEDYNTFTDYFNTLKLECGQGKSGRFTWTPDSNTPDLLYYQCFTHNHLGWKIVVVDDYEQFTRLNGSPNISLNITMFMTALTALILFV